MYKQIIQWKLILIHSPKKADINTAVDDEYGDLEPLINETKDNWYQRLFTRFKNPISVRYAARRIANIFNNKNASNIPEYMELKNIGTEGKELEDRELENADEGYRDLLTGIMGLYPEFEYDYTLNDNKALFKNFRINEDGVVEVRPPCGSIWRELTSDDGDLPKKLKGKLGWSKEHIEDYTAGKKSIDSFFPKNTITREGGFDIRVGDNGFPEVYDTPKKGVAGWYSLFVKGTGEDYNPSARGTMTNKIRDALGPTAESLMNDLAERVGNLAGNMEVMEDRIDQINSEISKSNESIYSNQGQIQDLAWEK